MILTLATITAGVSAEQRGEMIFVRPPAPTVRFSGPWRPNGTGTETRVIGTVIDIRQVPVSHARVQLRDLKTGSVLATTDTNGIGEYAFSLVDPGTYVVEMVMADNSVVALSNAGSLRRYETMNTVVVLPGRWDFNTLSMVSLVNTSGFFGMSSLNTMTASTLTMAVASEVKTTSAEPVSPQ
jgi:hypothetical protein